jgi:hypothetical protein
VCSSDLAALGFGGVISGVRQSATELWNGTSWTEVNDLTTARSGIAGCGTNTAALAFGGSPNTAATEEWSGPQTTATASTLTTS